jgi:hypothetical protein
LLISSGYAPNNATVAASPGVSVWRAAAMSRGAGAAGAVTAAAVVVAAAVTVAAAAGAVAAAAAGGVGDSSIGLCCVYAIMESPTGPSTLRSEA